MSKLDEIRSAIVTALGDLPYTTGQEITTHLLELESFVTYARERYSYEFDALVADWEANIAAAAPVRPTVDQWMAAVGSRSTTLSYSEWADEQATLSTF